jgi:outer membrane protein OmpA-like peptidoglycan-associated protein
MKKLIVILLFIVPLAGISQSAFLEKARNRTKNKVEQRALSKIDKETDKKLDEIENGASSKDKKDSKDKEEKRKEEKMTDENSETQSETETTELKSYSKYDFVPGEKVIYLEDFAQDEIGELPQNWNTGGKAELVTLDAFPGKWLRLFQNSVYLTSNTDSFSKNFTVEFDIILQLKNLGYTYPYISFGFFSSNGKAPNDNSFLNHQTTFQSAQVYVRPSAGGSSSLYAETYVNNGRHFLTETQNLAALESYYNKVSHVAMQVQGSRYRIWVNGEKKFDLPMALATQYTFNQLFFEVQTSSYKDDQIGIYINNIKVAKGKPDTRKKLLEEGKFSTTGILFDLNSAVIKPESFGVIKEVANALQQENIKIKIIGHTSSDGDDQANLELSKKRAAAVKQALVTEFKIDASRVETDGQGETQPVGDNKTSEGKAQNRRVEFIKL